MATRIVDQNLKRFCENIQLFKSVKNKVDFAEVGKNFSVKLDAIFSLEYYNSCMLQDGINQYNKILGGFTKENGEKIKGLNELINKYRQDNKGDKLNFFKLLDKQLLSEKQEFIENIKDDSELLEKLREFHENAEEKTNNLRKIINHFLQNSGECELDKVYLSKEGLNTILHKWMNDEGQIEFQKIAYEQTKKDGLVKFDKTDESYKFPDFIMLSLINNVLNCDFESEKIWKEQYFSDETNPTSKGFITKDETKWEQFLDIFRFEFEALFYKEIGDQKEKRGYNEYKEDFKKIIERKESEFSVSPEDKLTIKNFVDNTLWIYQMGKYFALEKKRKWLDEYETGDFYNHPELGYKTVFYNDAYDKIVKARMLLQSYLTRKPFSTEKWKLNFENPTLADGFDKNKESDNSAVILRKDNRYYLAVMKKGHNKIFDNKYKDLFSDLQNGSYEKMIYKLLPGPNKMLPKVFFSTKNIDFFDPSDEILNIRNYSSHTKNGNPQNGFDKKEFSIKDCHKLIDFFKQSIKKHEEWKNFNFKFSHTSSYKDTSEFYKEVLDQGYNISFQHISKEYITQKNENGELFLFSIHNKDWNLKDGVQKTGSKNLHTMYFESLFSDINKESNFPFKLNGQAELFYRPKTDTGKLGSKLDNKGNKVIDHKRYSEDKIFFHVPITLNRTASDSYNFNQRVNEFLVNNPDINIIGLDRGEKHLIYYAGIDQKGNLLKDKDGKAVLGSLNEINGVNYHLLLEERAKGREKARQDWQNIEGIKDLKRGYISLVVRQLADLIIEHNAILVFEDLNMRFKQIRGGIEKSVYQQLEKALIEKLNFLIDKGEKNSGQAGHLLRAYQLTAPFITFKDMGKQTGVIFYTQASYTSKTCPDCGFRPNIKWDQDDLLKNIKISYQDDSFIISYKMSDFIKNKNKSKRGNILFEEVKAKDEFMLSTKDAIRYKWSRRNRKASELKQGEEILPEQTEKGVTIKYDITEAMKGLLENEGISLQENLNNQIAEKISTKKFFKDLSYYLHLLSNTRSSVSGTGIDHINCPSCGFHSNNQFKGFEFNGDANGAYNVARKGIMILEKISQYFKEHQDSLDGMNWGDLFIDIEEWDKFTQS